MPPLVVVAVAILLALVLAYLWLASNSTRSKDGDDTHRLPPGPTGLPVLGNLHMLGDLPHRDLHRLANKYGPIMHLRLGVVPTVVVSTPAAAQLFLKTYDSVFASRPKSQAGELLFYGYKGVGFTPNSPYWRNMRKFCTMELLSNTKIDSFKYMRKEELNKFVGLIKDAAEATSVVDVSAKVGSVIEDITYRMVFGKDRDSKFNIIPLVKEALTLSGSFNLANYLPYVGALDLKGMGRGMKAVSRAVDELLEKIIDERVQDIKDHQSHRRKNFIDVMVSLMLESKNSQEEHMKMDRTNIKAIALDMLVGSLDTSATTIEWAMSELLRHPKVMKKLQQELEDVVGMDRMVEEEDLVKLNYLDMVIKECFRLHPLAPLLIPRECMKDITVNGYHIPEKCRVIINAWSIGRCPDVWSNDVEEFLPERFIGTNIDVRGHDFQLLPFGSGRRGCSGMQLGITMVRLVLAQLVHCFNWEIPGGITPNELDMTEKFRFSLPRANHLLALPTYRLLIKNL